MQFITHRDPVNVGGWATALGATGDAINNVLKIYTQHQQQKKEDEARAFQQKMQMDEMDLRRQEFDRRKAVEDLNTAMVIRRAQEERLAKGLPGERPTENVETGTLATKQRNFNIDPTTGAMTEAGPAKDIQMTTFGERKTPVETVRLAEVKDQFGNVLLPAEDREKLYEDELLDRQIRAELKKGVAAGTHMEMTPETKTVYQELVKRNPALTFYGPMLSRDIVPRDALKEVATMFQKGEKRGVEVGGDYYEEDPSTGQWKKVITGYKASANKQPEAPLTPKQLIDEHMSIAKQYEASTKDSRKAIQSAKLADSGVKDAEKLLAGGKSINAASQAAVTMFNKILDPASVVRESEYGRLAGGQALYDRIVGKVQQWKSGGAGISMNELRALQAEVNSLLTAWQEYNTDMAARSEHQMRLVLRTQFGREPTDDELNLSMRSVLAPRDYDAYYKSKANKDTNNPGDLPPAGGGSTTPTPDNPEGIRKPPPAPRR